MNLKIFVVLLILSSYQTWQRAICTVLCWCVSFRNALVKILSNFTISEIQYIAVCLQLRDDLTMSLCCVGWCKCRLNFKKEVLHLMQIWCASNIHWSWREEIRFCCVCDSFIHYPQLLYIKFGIWIFQESLKWVYVLLFSSCYTFECLNWIDSILWEWNNLNNWRNFAQQLIFNLFHLQYVIIFRII